MTAGLLAYIFTGIALVAFYVCTILLVTSADKDDKKDKKDKKDDN
jgi:hypothetical protein